jgi:hypothetical protein
MKLQTQIPLEKQSNNLIDYNSNVLLLGSCFSDNIGNKLDYFKFQNSQNPFGVLFHAKAIETLIINAIEGKVYSENDIFFHNEQWHCFDAHSKLSNTSKENLLNDLNNKIKSTNTQIRKATHVIVTLGTAWMYRFVETNAVVANCHKVPQKQFVKELMSVEDLKQSLENVISLFKNINSEASIIFTVSPIRHLKDGFTENTQSKAHLITSIHHVLSPGAYAKGLYYFPSYEIIMDELRDYRFYEEDMIHPSKTAINYIWKCFVKVWVSQESLKTLDEIDTIQKGLQHIPFNLNSEAYQKFLQNLEYKKAQLQLKFQHISF